MCEKHKICDAVSAIRLHIFHKFQPKWIITSSSSSTSRPKWTTERRSTANMKNGQVKACVCVFALIMWNTIHIHTQSTEIYRRPVRCAEGQYTVWYLLLPLVLPSQFTNFVSFWFVYAECFGFVLAGLPLLSRSVEKHKHDESQLACAMMNQPQKKIYCQIGDINDLTQCIPPNDV